MIIFDNKNNLSIVFYAEVIFYLIGNFALRRNFELKGPDKTGPRKAEVYWL
ncbi:hypothetical protein SAMN04487928_12342 [Butyrivibrio proteoclasticus]|uniref:Uncharacterized protein n=1 Tax=Butyrivibrio proteoclasticus TaxID=43305 RepID=A0A1I5WKR1_9FIRM|nr:hypothetical protein SAMN04487928_12342 [Butyrivibrio proteoclasticus]